MKCVIRADYKRPRRIELKRIREDLKQEEAVWMLEPVNTDMSDAAGPGPVTTVVCASRLGRRRQTLHAFPKSPFSQHGEAEQVVVAGRFPEIVWVDFA